MGDIVRQGVVAFVAEFSRGKSELINAIFFADAGQRVLPATPGRTTPPMPCTRTAKMPCSGARRRPRRIFAVG